MLAIVKTDVLKTVFGPTPTIVDQVDLLLGVNDFSSLEEKVTQLDGESAVLAVTFGKPSKDDGFQDAVPPPSFFKGYLTVVIFLHSTKDRVIFFSIVVIILSPLSMFTLLKVTDQTCELFIARPNDGKVVNKCLEL